MTAEIALLLDRAIIVHPFLAHACTQEYRLSQPNLSQVWQQLTQTSEETRTSGANHRRPGAWWWHNRALVDTSWKFFADEPSGVRVVQQNMSVIHALKTLSLSLCALCVYTWSNLGQGYSRNITSLTGFLILCHKTVIRNSFSVTRTYLTRSSRDLSSMFVAYGFDLIVKVWFVFIVLVLEVPGQFWWFSWTILVVPLHMSNLINVIC